MTVGIEARTPDAYASPSELTMSRNSGSPPEPGSLVRSSTAMRVAVAGIAAKTSSVGHGRYRRIEMRPTLRPCATSRSTAASTLWVPDPMAMTTSVASGSPWYETRS